MSKLSASLREFYGTNDFVALHEPKFTELTSKYVNECIDTGWVSSAGRFVSEFEHKVSAFTNAKHAIAVSSGTAALHLSLLAAGVKHDDEVICPNITFVASANAISYLGASPHLVDVALDDMCIDCDKLEDHLSSVADLTKDGCVNKITGKRIAAILVVHAFGFAADLHRLFRICELYNLKLVEDAACAIGSKSDGHYIGADSEFAAFSFNGNKLVTGGNGGLVLTRDDEIYHKIKHLSTTAKQIHRWEYIHDEVGYNYRMTNLSAAILVSQIENLDETLRRKRLLFNEYEAIFKKYDWLELIKEKKLVESNYWLFCVKINEPSDTSLEDILYELNEANIMARPLWRPISLLKPYLKAPRGDLSNSYKLYQQVFNIPSSPQLLRQ